MNATTKTWPEVKVTLEVITRPIAPCELIMRGQGGEITVNGGSYLFSYLGEMTEEGFRVEGYHFEKPDGESYDLPEDLSSCECGDYLARVRPGGCKHIRAVRMLRERGVVA